MTTVLAYAALAAPLAAWLLTHLTRPRTQPADEWTDYFAGQNPLTDTPTLLDDIAAHLAVELIAEAEAVLRGAA